MDVNALTQSQPLQAWVPFDDESEILIAYVPRDELQNIFKRATKIVYKNHKQIEEYDRTEGDRLLGRRAVKDWRPLEGNRGFTNDGQPFPCTPENIETLMTKWSAFAVFVNDACVNLEALAEIRKKDAIKNSLLTSGQG